MRSPQARDAFQFQKEVTVEANELTRQSGKYGPLGILYHLPEGNGKEESSLYF